MDPKAMITYWIKIESRQTLSDSTRIRMSSHGIHRCPCEGYGVLEAYEWLLPPKIKLLSPENQWLEDVFPIELVP